jgi:hypothetical protein
MTDSTCCFAIRYAFAGSLAGPFAGPLAGPLAVLFYLHLTHFPFFRCILQAKKAKEKDEEVLLQLEEKSAILIQAKFRGRKQMQLAKSTMGFFRYQKAMEVWPDMDR